MQRRQFVKATGAGILGAATLQAGSPLLAANGPVTFLVGFAAGGGLDVLSRLMAQEMGAVWNRSVIVSNKPGAAGQLAVQGLKTSPPDGSFLMPTAFAVPVMNPTVYKLKDSMPGVDYLPVAQWCTFEFSLVIPAAHPAKDFDSLVAWVREKPDERAVFGTAALGNLPHFLGLKMGNALGFPMRPIGYKGGAAMMTDLVGGQIPMGISNEADFVELEKNGRLRTIATFGTKRSPTLPQIPTVKERGVDVVASSWYGLFAPPQTPPSTIDEIANTVDKVLRDPVVSEKIRKMGIAPTPGVGAAAFAKLIEHDRATWIPVIQQSGFSVN